MDYSNRRYLVIPTTITDQIDFTEVLETSEQTLIKSVDESLTFVKYNVEFDENGNIISGRPSIYDAQYDEYTHSEILTLLSTEAWTPADQELI